MKRIDVKAYAKINLAIDVLGTLPSGYHEVSMIMQQIALCDRICVKWFPEGQAKRKFESGPAIEIGSNRHYLPKDQRNLAYKAAELMFSRFGQEKGVLGSRVRIDIKKQIPVGAGLGGGSADAAAVLHALARLWGIDIGTAALCNLSAELGADVPFCVLGQAGTTCAHASGTGTQLEALPGIDRYIVLSKPPLSVSTAEVYSGYDGVADQVISHPDMEQMMEGLRENNYKLIYKNMTNVLENFTLKAYPSVVYTKNKMQTETSASRVLMSGSGPTIIGVYESKKEAEGAYKRMVLTNKETYLTKTM